MEKQLHPLFDIYDVNILYHTKIYTYGDTYVANYL